MEDASVPPPDRSHVPPRTIALIGKYHSLEIADSLCILARNLHDRGIAVIVEQATANCAEAPAELRDWTICDFTGIGERADLAIVLGGDGTMLNIARCDMLTCMDDLLNGRFKPENRMLLVAEVLRGGSCIATSLALNDVVVDKGSNGRLIEFDLFIDSEFIYNLRSDGLIASTPTGSTAYSLSANGPILHPHVSGIALVPLCPHSLTNRPILVGDRSEIEIRIVQATDSRVHFDGQVTVDLRPNDWVRIIRSEFTICLLQPPGYSYFAMLRQKLHWSEKPVVN